MKCIFCGETGMVDVYHLDDPFFTAVCRCDCAKGDKYQSFPQFKRGKWVRLRHGELPPDATTIREGGTKDMTAKDCHFQLPKI